VADDDALAYELELADRERRGRKRRALEQDEESERAVGRKRPAAADASVESAGAESPVQRLQRRYGNAGLLQLRSTVQRRRSLADGDAPSWIKDELGVTAETEENARQARTAADAAETLQLPGGGSPLARDVREPAERALGVPLGDVNVVERGDSATNPLQAHALAAADESGGHSVVLSSGVDLGSGEGQFTLMHELAHVAQQKKGEADALEGLGGDESVREHLERKADDDAQRLLSRPD
jgi:hypothetical protein